MDKLNSRRIAFELLFESLQETNSRNEKEFYVHNFKIVYPEYVDDLIYILETLDGQHPIHFTLSDADAADVAINTGFNDFKTMIKYLENLPNTTDWQISVAERTLDGYLAFLAPIVNRTLKLGIGKSLLVVKDTSPMLAKKYENGLLSEDCVLTEKLDGNRCIALYENGEWRFFSRSGKPLNVYFDMHGMPTEFIYDGEMMTKVQTEQSIRRHLAIAKCNDIPDEFSISTAEAQLEFNKLSGIVNNKSDAHKKALVYNIFDIITLDKPYYKRRGILQDILNTTMISEDVRILPVLYIGTERKVINNILQYIVGEGGEGVMLNNINGLYEHKRSKNLMKYKMVQFMDMRVISTELGTGKYEGMVGALNCMLEASDGRTFICKVGSGLSDSQRGEWSWYPELIKGKIVQVAYHEITQDDAHRGTNIYSLRFPRLIKVRKDKEETSEY